ncbi:MAG: HAMP domain-containing histidine kinase [Deltaproteobacteria bacterium]|nr:HAMP domain-containing histidine kinase [Deltaproteobacteria bacterium]
MKTQLYKRFIHFYEKFQTFFISHHLAGAEDNFEAAKIKLVLSFFITFALVTITFLPFFFIYQIPMFTYLNISFYILYAIPFVLLKYGRSYEVPSFLFAAVVVLHASMNSIFNNGLLTPNISVWYFIAVAFCAYITRPRYILSLVIFMYVCLSVIDWLKYNDKLFINPHFSVKENLDATPFIMVLTFPLILKLLIEYVRSKQDAIAQVKATLSEKEKILGIVAHDLRNPMGGAVNCIEMSKKAIENNNPENAFMFLTMADNTARMALAHMEELLELSSLRENSRPFHRQAEDLVPFIRSIVDVYVLQAKKKQITLRFDPQSSKVFISMNKLRFSRLLDNVISNAIKFTGENGKIDVSVTVDGNNALITVKDTGIGIPNHLKDTLFAEYTPSARKGTDNETSTGLGMSIAKKIITLHEGKIWFDSEEGKGTTFYIQVPRQKKSASQD